VKSGGQLLIWRDASRWGCYVYNCILGGVLTVEARRRADGAEPLDWALCSRADRRDGRPSADQPTTPNADACERPSAQGWVGSPLPRLRSRGGPRGQRWGLGAPSLLLLCPEPSRPPSPVRGAGPAAGAGRGAGDSRRAPLAPSRCNLL
jgi:hypothetical protein